MIVSFAHDAGSVLTVGDSGVRADITRDAAIILVADRGGNGAADNTIVDIRAIDVDTNGAVEIWGMWDGEPSVAYLFPYDEGVVYY